MGNTVTKHTQQHDVLGLKIHTMGQSLVQRLSNCSTEAWKSGKVSQSNLVAGLEGTPFRTLCPHLHLNQSSSDYSYCKTKT